MQEQLKLLQATVKGRTVASGEQDHGEQDHGQQAVPWRTNPTVMSQPWRADRHRAIASKTIASRPNRGEQTARGWADRGEQVCGKRGRGDVGSRRAPCTRAGARCMFRVPGPCLGWVRPGSHSQSRTPFIAPPLSGLRMRTLSGGARHFVEKQHLREDPIPPPHLHALKINNRTLRTTPYPDLCSNEQSALSTGRKSALLAIFRQFPRLRR